MQIGLNWEILMSTGLLFAGLSSLSLALMVIIDRIMINGCYNNRPSVAWQVSAIGGVVFGLPMTFMAWAIYGDVCEIGRLSLNLVGGSWDGAVMALIGLITIQVMKYYFDLFTPSDKDEGVDETAIAMWLATAPVFIFIATLAIKWTGLNMGLLANLKAAGSPVAFFAILAAVAAVILFETGHGQRTLLVKKGRAVVMMLLCIVGYSILTSALLHERPFEEVLALQPFYWLGYGLGIRGLFGQAGRQEWREALHKLRSFFWVIVVAEFFGACVYFFEVYALWELSPTTVNLVVGANVVPVFVLSILIAKYRRKLVARGEENLRAFGVMVGVKELPDERLTGKRVGWLMLVALTLGCAIVVT